MARAKAPKRADVDPGVPVASQTLPTPTRPPLVFDGFSLEDLRVMRTELAAEETKVSYWRRILQARIDVLRAGSAHKEPIKDLRRVLADAANSHRRVAVITLQNADEIPPLPDLADLWSRMVDPADEEAERALLADLELAEHEVSALRAELHRRIDAATSELIARYRSNPALALLALPERH